MKKQKQSVPQVTDWSEFVGRYLVRELPPRTMGTRARMKLSERQASIVEHAPAT